ncbi:hypothetical protein AFM11_17830 [Mycolicibacterium wolinskyi]|uniref:Diacylglycerol O-acyltransferase n=1 Tax=Mycolicibacterium wolinskyi TaxID=59750 RepID=A0A132PKD8_9MYCO|nr:wax ester/triacylglycerol synthase family O-acyltransferase [Mycolicibacterium wolinskyi]KWX22806.1 hypothetical protein AFM11_17830 [Mycolicibacterium wolinskyi]
MRRLKGEDNSFLAWESETQPQHTIKAVVMDPAQGHEPITFESVKATLPGLVDHIEPLQWQLHMPRVGFGRPWWRARSGLDMDYHVQRVTAAAPGGDRELAATIAALCRSVLDRNRPAWQMFYVDGLSDGRIALVLKIHHAVADGSASLRLLELIYSADPATRLPAPRRIPLPDERRPRARTWYRLVLRHQFAALTRFPGIVSRTVAVTKTIRRRQQAGLPGYAEAFTAPPAPFNEPLTADRRFAYHACDLAEIRAVAKAFDVTINDVFLAICSGALRAHLHDDRALPDEPLTAVVPVSMRPPGCEADWGNQVARWNIDFATHIADPVQRLNAIAGATRIARDVQAERDAWLQHDWMEYWPLFWVYSRVLPILGARVKRRPMFSLIASNMRGPQRRLHWDGAPVERLISSGPLVFPMGLNFTGWSYLDEMVISVLCCGDQLSDPGRITDAMAGVLDELSTRAGSLPVQAVEQRDRQPRTGVHVTP